MTVYALGVIRGLHESCWLRIWVQGFTSLVTGNGLGLRV